MINFKIILSIFLFGLFSKSSTSQDTDSIKLNSINIGVDGYFGFNKAKDLFSFKKIPSENLYMQSAFFPNLGYFRKINEKTFFGFNISYGSIKSCKLDTFINNIPYSYERKLRDTKIGGEVYFTIISTNTLSVILNANVGLNIINEKYEYLDNTTYNKIGYGGSLILRWNEGILIGLWSVFKYYQIADNKLFGAGISLPIYRF